MARLRPWNTLLLAFVVLVPLVGEPERVLTLSIPEIFEPGVISGPASDGSPVFTPDGNTLFFTRSAAAWSIVLQADRVHGHWSRPVPAPFSGEWPDSSPAISQNGSFIVFNSIRPIGADSQKRAAQLYRVDRVGLGWSKPYRLPDSVNIGHSIWKPSIAADGTLYFLSIDSKGQKRLYSSEYANSTYNPAQPLSFSNGTTGDVDPEIARDKSFLVFSSSGRVPDDPKDHLFIVFRNGENWGAVAPIRYQGDDNPSRSTDDDPTLSLDQRTLYFSSDRSVSVAFPRTRAQVQTDFERLEQWDNGNSNVWSLSLGTQLGQIRK